MVKPDMCSCCREVWNSVNLKPVCLGEHNLYLCPDCFKEYNKIIKRAYIGGQKNPSKKYEKWIVD